MSRRSNYDDFWLSRMDEIEKAILRAINNNVTVTIDVGDLKLLGKRTNWSGLVYIDNDGHHKAEMAHAKSLGSLIVRQDFFKRIFENKDVKIKLRISKNLELDVSQFSKKLMSGGNLMKNYNSNKEFKIIYEGDVVDAVISYLKKDDYEIVDYCHPHQRGYDIIAKRNDRYFYVEAKGNTSSNPTSNRYGKGFDSAQTKVHVAGAIYKAMETKNSQPDSDVAIAFPDTARHNNLVKNVYPSLEKLDIKVLLVDEKKNVKLL